MTEPTRRFPYFDETKPPEGGEGWESMYPFYLVPSEETRQDEHQRLWFADTMHWSHGAHPFDSIGAEAVYLGAGQSSTRIFALPTALGLDVRIFNGYVYISPTAVEDPALIQERLAHFQERAGHYYANWDSLYEAWKTKVMASIEVMRGLSFPTLGTYDPVEGVKEGWGRSQAWDTVTNYHRLIDEFFLVWQYHFEFLNLGYGGYITFFQFCKTAFPLIEDQQIARMVAGVDVIAFRPDAELRRLAHKAAELGVGDLVTSGRDAAEVFADLEAQGEAGRTWLAEYEVSRNPWFNDFAEYGFTHDQESWVSNPNIPLQGIARYVTKLQAGESIERSTETLVAERDELVSEYRALLTPAEAAQFDELVNLARKVFPYIEEHNIYVEHWTHQVFFQKMWELARFLVEMGYTEAEDDLFFLNRFELDQVLADVLQSWAIGVPARGVHRWRAEIARRRPIVKALQSASAAPAFGVPPAEVTDPFAVMNYGVTTERVNDWLGASEGPSERLNGVPGSPGVVEGKVRVLRSEKDLPSLQPGEILVAPITAPSWAAAFSVAAGVITDIGGMMCHAAIVCREYAIPAVVGTGFATTRLTTGQRVRLDGKTGVVTLLEAQADE